MIGNYQLQGVLGKGGFSVVYRAIHIPTQLPVAIKKIDKSTFPMEKFERELTILKSLEHPFAISFYEFLQDDNYYYLVMELIEGTTLLDRLNHGPDLPEWRIRHYFVELLSVLNYLHNTLKVAHRDLKNENIMIDENENIRLIDP